MKLWRNLSHVTRSPSQGDEPIEVVELEPAEVEALARRHPEVRPGRGAIAVTGVETGAGDEAGLLDRLVRALFARAAADAVESEDQAQADYDRLIEAMSPRAVPTSARVLQARWNAEARDRFVREHGAVPAPEVARLAGYETTSNPSMPASRWQTEGKAFSVVRGGRQLFPLFQFGDDGRPLAIVAPILEAFGDRPSGWQVALWFDAPNVHLDGARPLDVLANRPDDVVRAAAYATGMPDF